jgi:large subunit ribosomal protein L18
VRSIIVGTKEKPRLSVKRSNKHIYAQLIDDITGATLASASDKEIDGKGKTKVEIASEVGKTIGLRAIEKSIKSVIFDRGERKYHGRIAALADGARESGLKF